MVSGSDANYSHSGTMERTFTGMDNIGNHTNDSLTARTQVAAGDTIAIKAAIAADLVSLAAEVAAGSPNATAISAGSELQ